MARGIITSFNRDLGQGTITDTFGKEVPFVYSSLSSSVGPVRNGTEVIFQRTRTKQGEEALRIRPFEERLLSKSFIRVFVLLYGLTIVSFICLHVVGDVDLRVAWIGVTSLVAFLFSQGRGLVSRWVSSSIQERIVFCLGIGGGALGALLGLLLLGRGEHGSRKIHLLIPLSALVIAQLLIVKTSGLNFFFIRPRPVFERVTETSP
jgi:cold shock CspA family protein